MVRELPRSISACIPAACGMHSRTLEMRGLIPGAHVACAIAERRGMEVRCRDYAPQSGGATSRSVVRLPLSRLPSKQMSRVEVYTRVYLCLTCDICPVSGGMHTCVNPSLDSLVSLHGKVHGDVCAYIPSTESEAWIDMCPWPVQGAIRLPSCAADRSSLVG